MDRRADASLMSVRRRIAIVRQHKRNRSILQRMQDYVARRDGRSDRVDGCAMDPGLSALHSGVKVFQVPGGEER